VAAALHTECSSVIIIGVTFDNKLKLLYHCEDKIVTYLKSIIYTTW